MFRQNNQIQISDSQTVRFRWRLSPTERGVPACLSYIVEGNLIRLPGRPGGVRFSLLIGDVAETEEAIVICLRVPSESVCRENVYSIDHDGNLLWRVKPQVFGSRSGPYIALSSQGDSIRLHSRDGRSHDLDPRTGSVIGASEFVQVLNGTTIL
jgi:outer membrane protein assembly factor BamB